MRMTAAILLIGLLAGVPAWAGEACPPDGCGRCIAPGACNPPASTAVKPPAVPAPAASAPVLYSETQWTRFRELAARCPQPADSPWSASDLALSQDSPGFVHYVDGVPDSLALTAKNIIDLMATVPEGGHCGTGIAWYTFERQQQDDTAVEVLRILYRNHSDGRIRQRALSCLSWQCRSELLPLWDEILRDGRKADQWPFAARGLCSINSPESLRMLFGLLAAPETEPGLLAVICELIGGTARPGGLEAVAPLLAHASSEVRFAAYKASLELGADRNELLGKALSDTETPIRKWGLRCIGPNPADRIIPRVLELLADSAPDLRAQADDALRYFICQAADNIPGRFAIMQQAMQENRWSYATAPLLTSRYGVLLEESGQLAEAAKAYTAAESSYSKNSAYRVVNFNPGATMLYRLVQVNRKMGDLDAARAVVGRLAAEYPGGTQVYLEDNPVSLVFGWHMISTVGEVTAILTSQLTARP